jgi:hypothetical protein
MPQLLEDLAEETSASNRRVADRLDAEVRNLDERRAGAAQVELGQNAVDVARVATDFAVSRVPQAVGFMRSALATLREEPIGEDAERLLRALLELFESDQGLIQRCRTLWGTSAQMGTAPERLDELNRAGRRIEELAAEVMRALEHRTRPWQPADPERLAQGLKLAREGKTVKADEARAWFRRAPGQQSS